MWHKLILAAIFLFSISAIADPISLDHLDWNFVLKGQESGQSVVVGKDLFFQLKDAPCCSGIYQVSANLIHVSNQDSRKLSQEFSIYIPVEGLKSISVNGRPVPNLIMGEDYLIVPLTTYSEQELTNFNLSLTIESDYSVFAGIWRGIPFIDTTGNVLDKVKTNAVNNFIVPLVTALILLLGSILFFCVSRLLSKQNFEFSYFSRSLFLWSCFNFFLTGIPRGLDFDFGSSIHMSVRILASLGLYYLIAAQNPKADKLQIRKVQPIFCLFSGFAYLANSQGHIDLQIAIYIFSVLLSFYPIIGLIREKIEISGKIIVWISVLTGLGQISDVIKILSTYHSFSYAAPYLTRYFNTPLILTSFSYYILKSSKYYHDNRKYLFKTKFYARTILNTAREGLSHDNVNYFLKVTAKITGFSRVSLTQRQGDGSYRVVKLYGSNFSAEGFTINQEKSPDIKVAIDSGSTVFGSVRRIESGWRTSEFVAVPVPEERNPPYLMLLSDPKKAGHSPKEASLYLSQISSAIWTNLERTKEQCLRVQTEQKFSSLVKQLDPSLYEFITSNISQIDDPEKMISSTRGILFFDQKSYTTMIEDFDDAMIGKFARIVGEWVTESAARYGARVSNFAGDAFLLETFCIGTESEKSIAQRTLSLVWNLAQTMGELNQILLREGFSPVTFRFGAHIGNVAAANLDFIQKGLSSSIGDTVNITARLQSIAKAGTIYISGELARYALDDFVVTEVPKQYVKGRLKKIEIFSLVGKVNSSDSVKENEVA